jgi:hypothetical protein
MYSSGVLDLTSPLTGTFWFDVIDCSGEPHLFVEFNQIRVELEFGSEFIKVTVFVGAGSLKLFEAHIDKDIPWCIGPNIYTECPINFYGWHGGTARV